MLCSSRLALRRGQIAFVALGECRFLAYPHVQNATSRPLRRADEQSCRAGYRLTSCRADECLSPPHLPNATSCAAAAMGQAPRFRYARHELRQRTTPRFGYSEQRGGPPPRDCSRRDSLEASTRTKRLGPGLCSKSECDLLTTVWRRACSRGRLVTMCTRHIGRCYCQGHASLAEPSHAH